MHRCGLALALALGAAFLAAPGEPGSPQGNHFGGRPQGGLLSSVDLSPFLNAERWDSSSSVLG